MYVDYRHIVWIYNMYICHLWKQIEKRDFHKPFWPVSQRVQIKFISPTIFLYCVYHAMSKSRKQLQYLLIWEETSIALIVFKGFSENGNIRNWLFSRLSEYMYPLILVFYGFSNLLVICVVEHTHIHNFWSDQYNTTIANM
jgi:hypothetical protein